MPEANALYTVVAVVVAGLAVWVAATLKTAKEPWTRPAPSTAGATSTARTPDVPVEKTEEPEGDEAKADEKA